MQADDYDDADSSYGTSVSTDTTSIKSNILNYRFENGRRYHAFKAGAYLYPNDEDALDQMDIEHHNQGLMLGRLHMSPIKDPLEILDVGTGTGIWAIDMADTYPAATITGIDLSPTQPSWVPPNLRFIVDDFTQECDDGSYPMHGAYVQWAEAMSSAFDKIGRPWPKGPDLKTLFENAGFVDVQVKELKRPCNDWPKDKRMKEIGRFTYFNFMKGLEGFTMAPFTRILGWTQEEVQVLIADVRKEFGKRSYHGSQKG
ncbi:hypothetical protein LTR70_008957 [Exophiala xenobiotica]|uniref:Methyltransferase n=1 Tax=Lithohypha guttulata TaxID=1690604 RepID=A0ABR0JZ71_9EURO|nr:hypothetical protein LTR24_008693 [Lithohypha guttulata]KAK5311194.1 hypothetical protein LTR70_008957 [Exophiala xenobiotica]